MNFENWCNGVLSKIRHHLENNEKKIEKDLDDF